MVLAGYNLKYLDGSAPYQKKKKEWTRSPLSCLAIYLKHWLDVKQSTLRPKCFLGAD